MCKLSLSHLSVKLKNDMQRMMARGAVKGDNSHQNILNEQYSSNPLKQVGTTISSNIGQGIP
jgi:hypothetical protein